MEEGGADRSAGLPHDVDRGGGDAGVALVDAVGGEADGGGDGRAGIGRDRAPAREEPDSVPPSPALGEAES